MPSTRPSRGGCGSAPRTGVDSADIVRLPMSHPTPDLFFDTMQAYQRTAALRAAIDVNLFTAIGDGAGTVPAIAAACQASERGTRILCDYLTIVGFLTKKDGTYQLTPDTPAFLSNRSP